MPAGERWPDGSLRPAYEDLGAGAVAARLGLPLAADAGVAVAAFDRWSVDRLLLMCRSGVELVDRGFGDDVLMAAAEGADDVVPVLVDGAFVVA